MAKTGLIFLLLIVFFLLPANQSEKPDEIKLSQVIKEIQGTWTGSGGSSEVRYRHPRGLLILTVKHETNFFFHVDKKGDIKGEGTIIYNLERNTTGLDDLAAQVQGMIGMLPTAIPSTGGMSGQGHDLTKQGVGELTKLQYDAPHLKNGKQLRHFKFSGRIGFGITKVEGSGEEFENTQKVIYLEPVLNFTLPGGKPNSTLIAAWEVNHKKEESTFPCWSPFLKNPGKLRRGPGGIWLAEFFEEGKNREGKRVWKEYAYVWMTRKSTINKE